MFILRDHRVVARGRRANGALLAAAVVAGLIACVSPLLAGQQLASKEAPSKKLVAGRIGVVALPMSLGAGARPVDTGSVIEIFGDWRVRCVADRGGKNCVFSQVQKDRRSGERVLSLDLLAPKDKKLSGAILLPFGLKLDSGVTLTLDNKPLGEPLRFSTCLPKGCLVQVSFAAKDTDALTKGKAMTIGADSLDGKKPMRLSVSLKGFAEAMSRTVELAQ